MNLERVFERKPLQWGLRGDPFLWEAIKNEICSGMQPRSNEEFSKMIREAFIKLVGKEPVEGKSYFKEEFSHGGMSSGHISCDFWLEKGFALLFNNFTELMEQKEQVVKEANRSGNNLVGVTGEYFVCAELGKRGILALLTPKNNPLFDVVAISSDAARTVSIQVKTMSERNKQGWKLGKEICNRSNNPNLFVVLVNLTEGHPDYFIYEYDVLSERVEHTYKSYLLKLKKDGTKRKDVAFRWYDFKYFTQDDYCRKNNWDILGF